MSYTSRCFHVTQINLCCHFDREDARALCLPTGQGLGREELPNMVDGLLSLANNRGACIGGSRTFMNAHEPELATE